MDTLIIFLLGFVIGGAIASLFFILRKKDFENITTQIVSQTEEQKEKERQQIIDYLKNSFANLSLEALNKSTQQFLQLASQTLSSQLQSGSMTLEEKKKLIDQTLQSMHEELNKVQNLIKELEKDRVEKFGMLTQRISESQKIIQQLNETTSRLTSALASSKVRGQWGERMAEDILRLSGLKEGINYLKQKAIQSGNTRPDYTFLLPNQLKVNMDVKFPYDNYMNYQNASSDAERETYKQNFLKDVRSRIKEVTTRDYINPAENTVDYVLVFIPNEYMYAFIMENDPNIIDEALKQRVILCSPITLYAILAIIRQAVDNFSLEQKASQIIELMRLFHKQWNEFLKSLENMGKKIDDAKKEFERLTTTRKNQLEKPLKKIEELREAAGIKLGIDNGKLISNGNDQKLASSDLDDE
ncbi:MAG: DNA recombination protein RmuC [Ignavibacteria bacterium]|jgi:DNA recombination protein RmuC|nr:DNA recombination protein RmuC [Ignavibacteria bacterium]MDH7527727.1 DNA recombination protein RmuC [Ignavibacteria bacterium]